MQVIALSGKPAGLFDGVHDYCVRLHCAMKDRGHEFCLVGLNWENEGWFETLRRLASLKSSEEAWILLQYTALQWSKRGFPIRAPILLFACKLIGYRVGVIFHDALPYRGERFRDRIRTRLQVLCMKALRRMASRCIHTIPVRKVSWLVKRDSRDVFLPVGPNLPEQKNLPEPDLSIQPISSSHTSNRKILVYGFSKGSALFREIRDIEFVMRDVSTVVPIRTLVLLGRESLAAADLLRPRLEELSIEVEAPGLISLERVQEELLNADLMLFVREHVSTRRGTAVAAVASGLPIVGYKGRETGGPIAQAGVLLVPEGDVTGLANLARAVLLDTQMMHQLKERSRLVSELSLSWTEIAKKLEALLSV